MSEHAEQSAVITWANMMTGAYPELRWLHSSLNGIVIPAPLAIRARIINAQKAAGMKKGIPDLFLPVARHGYHGLFIEMKVNNNKPTEEQKEFMAFAEEQGYLDKVCYGADEAIDALKWYLER
jgi:hypothetical protein